MDVEVILQASKATAILPGEIGEVDVRVCRRKSGDTAVVIAYMMGVLSEADKKMLAALREYLISMLERAHYKTARTPPAED